MGKIVCLMGKSSTGKDTIFKELLRQGKLPLRTIVPYTTRPIRAGEKDGVEYKFTDEAGFRKLRESGCMIEDREYHTVHGLWRYFTMDEGQFEQEDHHYILIGTLEAYQKMVAYFGEDRMIPIMIELDDGIRLQRALNRERKQRIPKYEEMCRRFLADSEDFAKEKLLAAGINRSFYNDDLVRCLREITEYLQPQLG